MYSYCGNNPVIRIDPFGLEECNGKYSLESEIEYDAEYPDFGVKDLPDESPGGLLLTLGSTYLFQEALDYAKDKLNKKAKQDCTDFCAKRTCREEDKYCNGTVIGEVVVRPPKIPKHSFSNCTSGSLESAEDPDAPLISKIISGKSRKCILDYTILLRGDFTCRCMCQLTFWGKAKRNWGKIFGPAESDIIILPPILTPCTETHKMNKCYN